MLTAYSKIHLEFFRRKEMKRILLTAIISVLVCEAVVFSVQEDKSILEQIGVKRGICVLAGDAGWSCALLRGCQMRLDMK